MNAKTKCTIYDIAKAAGVDISTASRALRDDVRVKESTKERIKKIADEMKYRPNLQASMLASGKTKTVWFALSSLEFLIERLPAEHFVNLLQEKKYIPLLALYNQDQEKYKAIIKRLEHGAADGAIIIPPYRNIKSKLFDDLIENKFPLVFLDRHPSRQDVPIVKTDNRTSVKMLIDSALENACDSFIIIGGEYNDTVLERKKAAEKILGKLDIPFIFYDLDKLSRIEFKKSSLPGKKICLMTNLQETALDFCNAHREALTGKNLSFAIFDLWSGSVYPAEKVFVCVQNFEKMAATAISLLMKEIEGKKQENKKIIKQAPKEIIIIDPNGTRHFAS
jgi:DNA-binding LacI/PurR family transcriptional regulator